MAGDVLPVLLQHNIGQAFDEMTSLMDPER